MAHTNEVLERCKHISLAMPFHREFGKLGTAGDTPGVWPACSIALRSGGRKAMLDYDSSVAGSSQAGRAISASCPLGPTPSRQPAAPVPAMASQPVFLPTLAAGQVIGPCQIERFLGAGGMGEVYLARHLRLEGAVALKILPPRLFHPSRAQRFLKEARIAWRIRHPNVITIHDVGHERDLYYLVMEHVDGRNLEQLVEVQGGPLPWRHALRITRLAALGLKAVHEHNLIHRDIKPSNIMVARDARVLLLDFGLVRELDAASTQYGGTVGTPMFMSPEQAAGEKLTCRSDIYSLGATLYWVLTRQGPNGQVLQEILEALRSRRQARPVHELNPFIPADVSQFVARSLAPDPHDRFADAAEFAKQAGKLLHAGAVKTTSTWETSSRQAEIITAELVPVLEPLERQPLLAEAEEPLSGRWRPALPWIAIGVGLVSLSLLWVFASWGRTGKGAGQPPAAGQGQQQASSSSSKTAERERLSGGGNTAEGSPHTGAHEVKASEDMVLIPAGRVQLGVERARAVAYLSQLPAMQQNAALLEDAVRFLTKEPLTTVDVPAFWIDKYEVTNAQYAEFVEATGADPPPYWVGGVPPRGREDHPVVNIRFQDAKAYARWRGAALPTRAQWVRAYRGHGNALFPWGDVYDPERANTYENPRIRRAETTPVTATPLDVNPDMGVYNLVGNVSEFIDERVTSDEEPAVVTKGCDFENGGSVYGVASAERLYLLRGNTSASLGFRCVRAAP